MIPKHVVKGVLIGKRRINKELVRIALKSKDGTIVMLNVPLNRMEELLLLSIGSDFEMTIRRKEK
ncbi:MAG: hypothetical protein J5622_01950 [Firmicutes bacterium]|nr:hypothetical protein [Bacillota bacterium]